MANANSMSGLCISFDTECRNSLSLKSLKRVLDNELVYDIKKPNVEYYDIKKSVENAINNNYFYNENGEKFSIDENEENISIDTYGDWIVSLLDKEDEKFITVINRSTGYFYSGTSIINSIGEDYRVRGSVPLRGCGELYKEPNLNEESNKIGGWVKVPASLPEEYNYVYVDISHKDGDKYKATRIYVILNGEHKGEMSESLEEVANLTGDFYPKVLETKREENSSMYIFKVNGEAAKGSNSSGRIFVYDEDGEMYNCAIDGWDAEGDIISLGSHIFYELYRDKQNLNVILELDSLKINGKTVTKLNAVL